MRLAAAALSAALLVACVERRDAVGFGARRETAAPTTAPAPTSPAPSAAPQDAAPRGPWTSIGAGDEETCVSNARGELVCWGATPGRARPRSITIPAGQRPAVSSQRVCAVIDGATRCASLPAGAPVDAGLAHARAVATSRSLVCALDDDVACAMSSPDALAPAPRITGVRRPVALGVRQVLCVAGDAGVSCANLEIVRMRRAQDRPTSIELKPVGGTRGAVDVAVGGSFACARTAAGAASCWAFHGPIGGEVAKPVRGLGVVVDVAVGDAHGCAVDEAGDVRCWGEDADGEVGVAVDRCPVVDGCATQGGCKHRCDDAVLVEGLPQATKVAAGRRHTCALTREGDVYCWGGDAQELGADASRPGPRRVAF